jgi:TonB family protein
MSYKALLFCPDPRVVRAVTQVLTELEFMTEVFADVFQTSRKLADERCDALVVDCQNEQDAAVLFKAARNSTVNHGSLLVAVVEGQAGVAMAFRIGANLVLTKPINVEQSKSTLRVAKGLLRKNDGKAAALAPAANESITGNDNPPFIAKAPAFVSHISSTATPTAAPFAVLEVENEQTPAPEPAEAAVLESLPNTVRGQHPAAATDVLKSSAEPIAASTVTSSGGAAAAAAMAPIKPAIEIKSAAPLASHEAIVTDATSLEPFEIAAAPTFSAYTQPEQESGKGKIFRNLAIVVVLAVTGYFTWQKLQSMHSLHGNDTGQSDSQSSPDSTPAAPAAAENQTQSSAAVNNSNSASSATDISAPTSPKVRSVPEHYVAPETIDVGDTSAAPQPKVTVTPKPEPIVVKTKVEGSSTKVDQASQNAPPTFAIAASDPDAALSKIVTSDGVVPRAALSSVRVSQGVSQGLLIRKVPPVYPAVALQVKKQGTVDLLATISKDGTITAIKVLSGDSALAKSAADAVRQWKYRPYLLNGEPVEIQTQVTINFKLPN